MNIRELATRNMKVNSSEKVELQNDDSIGGEYGNEARRQRGVDGEEARRIKPTCPRQRTLLAQHAKWL